MEGGNKWKEEINGRRKRMKGGNKWKGNREFIHQKFQRKQKSIKFRSVVLN